MNRRMLGASGRQVFPLGLGCMGMSWGYAESGRDDAASIRVIQEAIDAGVNLIDTARIYGDGHNERLVGEAVRGRHEGLVIASKGGMDVDLARRRISRDGRPDAIRRHVDEGLAHLGIERIDLYYLHRVDPAVPLAESWGALAELADEGKIGALGLSEVSVAQAEAAHAIHPVSAVQSELSIWTRDPMAGDKLLQWTEERGVAFIPFAPLGRGYLTGTLEADGFEAGDFRATNPRFTVEAFSYNRVIGEAVAQIAAAQRATAAQVSLAWLLGLSGNVIPIPGTRRSEHLQENLKSLDLRLTVPERQLLDGLPAPRGSRY